MPEIIHITPREAALQRENERLTDKTERQSATIHVQAVAIQALQADAERIKAMSETGTAESFLALSDDDKRLFFASAVEESARCKKLRKELETLQAFYSTPVSFLG